MIDRLAAKSYHAKAIGAVNTIIPLRHIPGAHLDGSTESLLKQANNRGKAGSICAHYGDNTDWIGIVRNLSGDYCVLLKLYR
jgi:shikimate 5-dehydrogenase